MSSLVVESWIWYGLTWMIVTARMVSRRLLLGSFRKLQVDDFLMFFAMATYTVLIVAMNIVSSTSSNLIDPDSHMTLTPSEIRQRQFGSKMVLVVEQMQILTIWSVKCCLLILYNRLTINMRRNLAVKMIAVYVIVGFVVMEVLYFAVWCRPFHQYWAVPPENVQCSAATNHLITNMVLNLSSDIMIIIIPIPLLLQSRIAPKKKLILCCVFLVGLFTITSAILNKYYSFTDPFGADWTFWYIRESSTALIAANIPLTWTLLRCVFSLGSFLDKTTNHGGSRPPTIGGTGSHVRDTHITGPSPINRPNIRREADEDNDPDVSRPGSQEHIHYGYPDSLYRINKYDDIEMRTDHTLSHVPPTLGAGSSSDGRQGTGSTV